MPSDPELPLTLAYVPWTSGSLGSQAFEGSITAIKRTWRDVSLEAAGERWEPARTQLIAWGCTSVSSDERSEHFHCGEEWEAKILLIQPALFSLVVGTTEFADCSYSGRNAEAGRPPGRGRW